MDAIGAWLAEFGAYFVVLFYVVIALACVLVQQLDSWGQPRPQVVHVLFSVMLCLFWPVTFTIALFMAGRDGGDVAHSATGEATSSLGESGTGGA